MPTNPSIDNEDRIVDYLPVVSTDEFAITWPVYADSEDDAKDDLVVIVDGVQLSSSEFEFTGTAVSGLSRTWNGGTVTLDTAVSNVRVIIYSDKPPRRTGSFTEGAALPMKNLDAVLNDFATQLRDVHLQTKRAVKFTAADIADDISPNITDDAADRAGLYLAYAADGSMTTATGTGNDPDLRTDLASSASHSVGDALIAYKRNATGATARTLHAALEDQFVNVKDFGALGDDSTNDYAAILAAYTYAEANGYTLFFPKGTYRFATALDLSDVDMLFDREAWLKPTSAVASPCLVINPSLSLLGHSPITRVDGLHLDGTLTTSKTGLKVCGNGVGAQLHLVNFYIRSFIGAGAIGLYVEDAVSCLYENGIISHCLRGLRQKGTSADLPTTQTYRKVYVRENTDTAAAAIVESGRGIKFEDSVFEQNEGRGLYVSLAAARSISHLILDNCWFELNWQSDPAATNTYECEIDNNSVDVIARVTIRDTFFEPMDPDNTIRHSLRMRGVSPYQLSMNGYGGGGGLGVADHVELDTCFGSIDGLQWDTDPDVFVMSSGITTGGVDVAQRTFPAQTQDVGNTSVTYQWQSDESEIFFDTPLTADRTVTLSNTNAAEGAWCNVTRMSGATGAFNLTIQREDLTALKVLATSLTWARFVRKAGVWVLQQAGSL